MRQGICHYLWYDTFMLVIGHLTHPAFSYVLKSAENGGSMAYAQPYHWDGVGGDMIIDAV